MHIHILGICGTFMGGLAQLARELGHQVTGADLNVYPPMSTQLEAAGIRLTEGYDPAQLDPAPDLVVIGNAMSRGNPCVEAVLDKGIPYMSGPQWLFEAVLKDRWVLAVSGTHGKTTTTSMLAWILEDAGLSPGFLVGGVPANFGHSARLGQAPFFVVEADEYDTAFFDKRSKFVHYRPRTLIINNLEFDHADIFADLAAIQRQFNHLLRMVPSQGLVITPAADQNVADTLDQGCWTPVLRLGQDLKAELIKGDGSQFTVISGDDRAEVHWNLVGMHNVSNALAALAAARHAGVPLKVAAEGLSRFQNVARRLEFKGEVKGVSVFDDFAHHPTAIATTVDGLRRKVGGQRILAVLEPRSNTMKAGVHADQLNDAVKGADKVFWFEPHGLKWSIKDLCHESLVPATYSDSVEALVAMLAAEARAGDHILVMSNGGFGGIHQKLLDALEVRRD
ncbi:UDP-N-acetylmuramate:L-alanyl-gamma-D-glutamyl-meso-diaminopimelate ligase [Gallaecimonas xiamenensis]|uniref:UDP-N-acetylmuramate--L-alanyl-gamma-D-glutamyl-meso-2,6-diaminoheptandioate ligase n=1 Tax=Gallaecimonas xiamenensis 3-C-1 TaxID=745411 RepID=K2JF47_9GAMM|nr:UDP-N-acetylmuramate:L-alanyl-gamma-D-glutamyl-meso-diaminopimelate ligase [Gallaecimonas xiamenensis]EKE73703.1 UDP-N-acetylmuramate:L-alanyl-gamma-D-glutamyl-meso-diaminopimelat ligase [Gallaecimonas xiamenensis 3-C-1]